MHPISCAPSRMASKLLPFIILAASCGDPRGSALTVSTSTPSAGSFFDTTATKGAPGSPAPRPAASPAPAMPRAEVFRGAYRRTSTTSEFFPCGAKAALPLQARGEALMLLRDRWRWHATAVKRPLYAVFQGIVVRDTARAVGDTGRGAGVGTAASRGPTHFLLVRMDSLRTWRNGDCGQEHPPRW